MANEVSSVNFPLSTNSAVARENVSPQNKNIRTEPQTAARCSQIGTRHVPPCQPVFFQWPLEEHCATRRSFASRRFNLCRTTFEKGALDSHRLAPVVSSSLNSIKRSSSGSVIRPLVT